MAGSGSISTEQSRVTCGTALSQLSLKDRNRFQNRIHKRQSFGSKAVSFKSGDWRHVVLAWKNFDTGRSDAHSALYIDGKLIGEISGRDIGMDWDLDKTGICVAVNFIGLLDEIALFNRALTPAEIANLHKRPDFLAPLKRVQGLP